MSTQARKTLEGIAQELAARYETYAKSRRAIEQDSRLSPEAKITDLTALQTAYTDDVKAISEKARAAKQEIAAQIGPLTTSTDPPTAGHEELTRWEIQKDRAARRILPRLEKAAGDPHELLEALQQLAQKAASTKDAALAAALREEYPWLIPDDSWGLQTVEAAGMRRVFTETLDQVLAPFVPQAEQEKRQQHTELEKQYESVAYSLQAAAEAATGQEDGLVLRDWDGTVTTIEGEPAESSAKGYGFAMRT